MQSQGKPHQISMQPQNGHVDLKGLRVSPDIKYLIQYGDSIGQYPSRSEVLFATLMALADAGYEDDLIARLCLLETHGISDLPREKGIGWLQQELNRACRKARSLTRRVQGEPLSVDDLKLHDMFQPPRQIIEGLLHEGMLLFGGKVKHGKSWLMLDLALSVATGTPVWGHFAVPEPQPVLYISLRDRRSRIKHRLDAIRPDFKTNGYLHLLWDFPNLGEGGLEKLRGYIEEGRYRLIVIDPLIRLAAYDKGCLHLLRLLADLRDLHRRHPVCLAVVMITTKPKIDRIFDDLPTSDHAPSARWFLKHGKPIRTLYIRDGIGIFRTLHLHVAGERWQYLSPGDKRDTESQLRPVASGK